MAQVILVQPKIGSWENVRSGLCPPLALLTAVSKVEKEFTVSFIDQRKSGWRKKIRKEIGAETLCVATTGFVSPTINAGIKISKFVKKISNLPVIWGGVTATLLSKQVIRENYIDIIVRGDGEITFHEIVKKLKKKETLEGVKGCWYKKNKKIIKNEDREPCDLNKIPSPPFNLINLNEYLPIEQGHKKLYFESSRGCMNYCKYCYNKPFTKNNWRKRNPELVISDIKKAIYNYPDIKLIYFIDSNFFADKQRVLKINKELTKMGLKWSADGGHIEALKKFTDKELEDISKSCTIIYCGIDSGSEKILKSCNRNLKIQDVIDLNKRIKRYNIPLRYTFMAGFPEETLKDIQKTISLMFRLKKDNPNIYLSHISILLLTPKTDMLYYAIKKGYKAPKKLKEWNKISLGHIDLPWITNKRKRFLKKIYRNSYFLNKKHHLNLNPLIKIFMRFYNPIAEYKLKKVLKLPQERKDTV